MGERAYLTCIPGVHEYPRLFGGTVKVLPHVQTQMMFLTKIWGWSTPEANVSE